MIHLSSHILSGSQPVARNGAALQNLGGDSRDVPDQAQLNGLNWVCIGGDGILDYRLIMSVKLFKYGVHKKNAM